MAFKLCYAFWIMPSPQSCPSCGASQMVSSPSGCHHICANCQRIQIQVRVVKPRGRKSAKKVPQPVSVEPEYTAVSAKKD